MATYIIKDAQGNPINRISATEEFVETNYPGLYELVIPVTPEPEVILPPAPSGVARRARQFKKLAKTDPVAALIQLEKNRVN